MKNLILWHKVNEIFAYPRLIPLVVEEYMLVICVLCNIVLCGICSSPFIRYTHISG